MGDFIETSASEIIGLVERKFYTPFFFHGNNHGFRLRFSLQPNPMSEIVRILIKISNGFFLLKVSTVLRLFKQAILSLALFVKTGVGLSQKSEFK